MVALRCDCLLLLGVDIVNCAAWDWIGGLVLCIRLLLFGFLFAVSLLLYLCCGLDSVRCDGAFVLGFD